MTICPKPRIMENERRLMKQSEIRFGNNTKTLCLYARVKCESNVKARESNYLAAILK